MSVKYNHNKKILTSELVVPDYDMEAVIHLAVTDSSATQDKMWGVTVDMTANKIPQLTLVGCTRSVLCCVLA